MSTIISKSMVAPVSLLEPPPAKSFTCKTLRSPLKIVSYLSVPSSSATLLSSSFCSRKLKYSSSSKRFSTSRRVCKGRSRSSAFSIRFQQSEDGGSVSMMNAGGSSQQEPEVNAPSSMAGKSLLAQLGQSINVAGIAFSSKLILKERHLAIPHVSVPDISWVDWKALRAKGFEAVLYTLTAPYGQNVWPSLLESLEECRAAFDGRLAMLSNSADGVEAKALEDKLGISVIRHGEGSRRYIGRLVA